MSDEMLQKRLDVTRRQLYWATSALRVLSKRQPCVLEAASDGIAAGVTIQEVVGDAVDCYRNVALEALRLVDAAEAEVTQ